MKWAAEQVRRGATLPPAVVLRLLDAHHANLLAQQNDRHMVAVAQVEMARAIVALRGEVARLRSVPWWRRLWLRVRGW